MDKSLKGTKTEANLWAAFAGESQARNKYTYYASKAKKEGYEQIAAIFEETANQEKEHAKRMFKYLEGGMVEITATYPAGKIGNTMENLSAAADGEREEWENDYPHFAQTALVRSRADIMRLFEKTRNITDILNDSLLQFEIETPFIPSELNPEFMKLTEFSTLAVEAVVPAAKAYFKAPDTVPDKISRAYFYEKEAVRYSQTIKRTVFHNMTNLKLSEKFHLRYFALHIENLSKAAENVADQLAVMSIRRTM